MIVHSIMEFLTINKDTIDILLKVLGFTITLISFLTTFFFSLNKFSRYQSDKKSQQISNWLQLFSDDNQIKKLSAVGGISNNIELVYPEVFILSVHEQDYFIKSMLYDALNQNPEEHLDFLQKYHNFFVKQYLILTSNKNVEDMLQIPEEFRKVLTKANHEAKLQIDLNRKGSVLRLEEPYSLDRMKDFILLSSQLLMQGLKTRKKLYLQGLLVIRANMHSALCYKKNIKGGVFLDNTMRHMKFIKGEYTDSIFSKCNLYDASIEDSLLQNVKFSHCKMMKMKFDNLKAEQIEILDCSLNESNFEYNKWNMKAKDSDFNGCTMKKTNFFTLDMIQCNLKGSNFYRTIFHEARLYRTELMGRFFNCTFRNIQFNGSVLVNTVFKKCHFYQCNFDGANIDKVKFIHCIFEEAVDFRKAQNYNQAIFEQCQYKNKKKEKVIL